MNNLTEVHEMHIPPIREEWTIGTVLAALTSILSLLSMFIGGIWFAARLDNATKNVPVMLQEQAKNSRDIAILQDQQRYTDMRYAEIMAQLATINQKLDQQREKIYDQHLQSRQR